MQTGGINRQMLGPETLFSREFGSCNAQRKFTICPLASVAIQMRGYAGPLLRPGTVFVPVVVETAYDLDIANAMRGRKVRNTWIAERFLKPHPHPLASLFFQDMYWGDAELCLRATESP